MTTQIHWPQTTLTSLAAFAIVSYLVLAIPTAAVMLCIHFLTCFNIVCELRDLADLLRSSVLYNIVMNELLQLLHTLRVLFTSLFAEWVIFTLMSSHFSYSVFCLRHIGFFSFETSCNCLQYVQILVRWRTLYFYFVILSKISVTYSDLSP
jgi:hypothetical protein